MAAEIKDMVDPSHKGDDDQRRGGGGSNGGGKRPDVQRYKPGAFNRKSEPEELIPGFSASRHK